MRRRTMPGKSAVRDWPIAQRLAVWALCELLSEVGIVVETAASCCTNVLMIIP
jgi:hypothetical protein